MLIIPAIDLKDGCVVRFVQGRLNKKVYSADPLRTARLWVSQGAKILHVVDLDGAIGGVPKNLMLLKKIVENSGIPVQFGGGVRNIPLIKKLLGWGVARIILGTKAAEDRIFLEKSLKLFRRKVTVSIDARNEKLMIKGWKDGACGINIYNFALQLKKSGLGEIIYTDTSKDGTLKGPNIKGIKAMLKRSGLKIIASGGISSLDDLRSLKPLEENGLSGIIVGKALYEGRFTLREAMQFS